MPEEEKEEKEILRFLVSSEMGHSPDPELSSRCDIMLKTPVTKELCYDFRGIRARVMCSAWSHMEKEKLPFAESIRRAWRETKEECIKAGASI
jgi:hypothetical protein